MRVEFIDPFIDAAMVVLNDVLDVSVTRGRASLKKVLAPAGCLSVSFGLAGDFDGTVMFDIPQGTAFGISSAMNRVSLDVIEPMVMDTVAELMNIIVGRSVTLLNDRGFRFNLTPPTILSGEGTGFGPMDIETLVIPVGTAYGDFAMSVAMRTTL